MFEKSHKRNRQFQERITHRSVQMRKRAESQALRRKEEYLGARVPRELKDLVLKRADELSIPVSILIRQVLEDAFGPVPATKKVNVSATAFDRGQHNVSNEAGRFDGILGWEEIKLNRPVNCAMCGAGLSVGAKVTLGIGTVGEQHVILCDLCKRSI